MQRLFTTFPNSWPGAGLLLLRLAAAAPLLVESVAFICSAAHRLDIPVELVGLGVGGLIAAGFFTPFAAFLQVLLQVWLGFHDAVTARGEHGLLAVMGAVLVMTGPGAWSVDARLFGRKRIDMDAG
jgi:putative oxidoreductase